MIIHFFHCHTIIFRTPILKKRNHGILKETKAVLYIIHFYIFSIWNYKEVRKILPTALYITLLRQDSSSTFQNKYFKL
jgi:hypothetical protein